MAKRKSSKKKKQQKKQDISLIVVIILSVLLTVLIYAQSGAIGIALSDFFGGMIGILKYILPLGAFAVAIKIIKNRSICIIVNIYCCNIKCISNI